MNRSETICSLQRIKYEEENKKREKVKLENWKFLQSKFQF